MFVQISEILWENSPVGLNQELHFMNESTLLNWRHDALAELRPAVCWWTASRMVEKMRGRGAHSSRLFEVFFCQLLRKKTTLLL